MSIIHDALKKAQQQRKQNTAGVPYNPPETKKKPRIALIGIVAVFAVAIVTYLYIPAFHKQKTTISPRSKAAASAPGAVAVVNAAQNPSGEQVRPQNAPAPSTAAKGEQVPQSKKAEPLRQQDPSPKKSMPQPETTKLPVAMKPLAANTKPLQASGADRENVRTAKRPRAAGGQRPVEQESLDEGPVRRTVVKKTEDEKIKAQYNEALNIMNSGRNREAQRMFLAIIGRRPDHVESLNNLGVICASQGNRKDALGYFKKILDYRADYPKAYNNIGLIMMSEDDPQLAEEYFRKAISLDPNGLEPYMNLCALLRTQGKFQEAAKALDAPIKKNIKDPLLFLSYAVVKDNLGQTGEAVKYYRQYLSLSKSSDAQRNGVLERLRYLESSGK